MVKKLKHTFYNYEFFIQTTKQFEKSLNYLIYSSVNDYIDLDKKYIQNGFIKNEEIKKIEKDLNISVYGDGYKIKLCIHIHNYVRVIFNFDDFINNLYNILNLNINNIILLNKKEIKEKKENKKEEVNEMKIQLVDKNKTKTENIELKKHRFI